MDKPKQFRRIPTTITAIQWIMDNFPAVQDFTRSVNGIPGVEFTLTGLWLYVAANKSWVSLDIDDWIAKDSVGFYPIKDEMMKFDYTEVGY